MSTISAEEVKESLSIFDINVTNDEVLNKLLEVAQVFEYDADSVVNEWLAYQSTHSCSLTLSNVEKLLFEKTAARNRTKNTRTPASNRKRKPVYKSENDQMFDTSIIEDEEEDLLDAYGTPGRVTKQRRTSNATPKSAIKAKSGLNSHLGVSPVFSPSTLSPTTTSSQKYSSRSNSGEAVVVFGPDHERIDTHKEHGLSGTSISINKKQNISKTYKYMFQKICDLSDVMDEMIENMAETIRKCHGNEIDSYAPCLMPSQEPVCIVGQVCCDQGGGVGRLNAQSVLLQGDRMTSYGKSVTVDLSQLDEYSLFPGQIVAMRGTNPSGKKFIPTKIFTSASEVSQKLHKSRQNSDPLSVLIAAGPFTTSDCLSYEPLTDLLSVVGECRPDLTILIGPILDSKNDELRKGKIDVPFDELLQDQLRNVAEALNGCTQLVVVSSQRDASCHPVYPQPPYAAGTQAKNVHFVGDPCVLQVGGASFAVTSNDILFHLGAEEISKVKGPSDRLGRLCGHILDQKSFYPLCPPNESVNVDWIASEQFGGLYERPDVLVLPSDLKCFVKDVDGCICVNPGRLAKGVTGGTYAKLLLECSGQQASAAKVVKI